MNFSEALKAMKMGSKVSREAWRGEISYWILFKSKDMTTFEEPHKIEAHYPDGEIKFVISVSLESVLADDWWIVT